MKIHNLAKVIDHAAFVAEPVEQLTSKECFDEGQAYDIQRLSIKRRLQRGELPLGVKMGFTSRAKMAQMGVEDMIIGRLTNAMKIEEGGQLVMERYIHPRVEPEIVFRLSKSARGPVKPLEATKFIDAVAPALEIIDSRYKNFNFTLEDVLADNCSSSGFVVGNWMPKHTDVSNLGIILNANGRMVQSGSTSAILGNPIRSLVEAFKLSDMFDIPLNEGDVVLVGAATAAVALCPGDSISAEFQNIGSIGFTVSQ